jgi:hypothetical protein
MHASVLLLGEEKSKVSSATANDATIKEEGGNTCSSVGGIRLPRLFLGRVGGSSTSSNVGSPSMVVV